MMKAQELIKELQNEINKYTAIIQDRSRRIGEGLTDIDDCFMSDKSNRLQIDLAKKKIQILKNGGTSTFTVLRDIETGEIVSRKLVDGRFGLCHLISDEYVSKFGRFVGMAKREATYTKKGLKQDVAKFPAWATTEASGSGLYGAYMAQVVVYQSKKNYAH
jgi:hypothetical protein